MVIRMIQKRPNPIKIQPFLNNWRTHAVYLHPYSDAASHVPTHPKSFVPVLVHILNGAAAGVVHFFPSGIPFKGNCC